MTTPVHTRATRYEVSAVPEDHLFVDRLTVTVEYRGDDRWAVTLPRVRACLSANGEWDHEVTASERGDDWLATHRFGFEAAWLHAREQALKLTAGGKTAAEHLAERA